MHERSAASTVSGTTGEVVPDDLRSAAALCQQTLAPLLDADWEQPVAGLGWSRRRTLQHIANALDWYTLLLAEPSSDQFLSLGLRYVEQPIRDLLAIVSKRAGLLARLAAVSEPSVRGYHYWGRPDPTGYVAMGCAEIVLHTDDIAQSFGHTLSGPDAPCRRLVKRLFPWAPLVSELGPEVDGWTLLRWATGRLSLPELGQVAPDWTWHASPVAEWDGEIKTRGSYPAIVR
jgi:hypothetical protein